MQKITLRSIIIISVALLLAGLMALANQAHSVQWNGYSLYAVLGVIAFVIQWIAFVPAYKFQTEHFYDLTGSLTYLTVIIFGLVLGGGSGNPRALLVSVLVIVWSLRLGSFLFLRIRKDGKDTRFDEIKPVFSRFLGAWTLQGLWVYLTLAAALVILTSTKNVPLDGFAYAGLAVWIFGFVIEVLSDQQKRAFRKVPANKGRFIQSGLWAWSRHPNYFGEITLWVGVFIISIPVLVGWQWIAIISPVFVYLLITRMSGVNMLEEIADKRWGGEPEYEAYKANTPELLLKPPKASPNSSS
ncbi:MAG: DUF1295 domain-containing protein [Gammaproteobacteria bacterium]|nr:DUF1295 domain-containing protein [Gammaproteobacteria bacterium]NNC97803.1 DUF1295 domain-containing protein [Gammaproteobacteria bacterium]NNM13730.1 DUF1295 domain-containing protein [Gammaproteobacteria bacterium]